MKSVHPELDMAEAKHREGRLDEAADLYRAFLAAHPQNPQALHMLGNVAFQKGNAALGLRLVEASLATDPNEAMAWHNRGLMLRALERREEALVSVRQALTLAVNYPEAWAMAGLLMRELGRTESARECHALALTLRPDDSKLKNDYAVDLLALNDLIGAYKIMTSIPKDADQIIPLTLANIYKAAGYPERALPLMRQARELLPHNKEISLNEASALLQLGRYPEGWKIWEQRPDLDIRFQSIPLWQRQKIEHLLVHEDQGMGDAIQCARFIPRLSLYADRLTLFVAPPLQRLMQENFPQHRVRAGDNEIPSADARVRLASLPALFEADMESALWTSPYIRDHASTTPLWLQRILNQKSPHVGIVWGGNPLNLNDARRSIPVVAMAPLFDIGGSHFISLQKGAHAEGANLQDFKIHDAAPYLDDFSVTATVMANLDLVITTCTSTAHLAGAMGVPAWLLLCFDPHWLWLLGCESTPWYPSLRLFRQERPGQWGDVVEKVRLELKKFIDGDVTPIEPVKWDGHRLQQNPFAIDLSGAKA